MDEALARARAAVDAAHEADPRRTAEGLAAELVYAERMEAWVVRLNPDADALLLAAGVDAARAEAVRTWVAKEGLKSNAGTQALEDAACLVFLENEIGDFAAGHADYTREKFLGILRRTWAKMSPEARRAALVLDLPQPVRELVAEAVASTSSPPDPS